MLTILLVVRLGIALGLALAPVVPTDAARRLSAAMGDSGANSRAAEDSEGTMNDRVDVGKLQDDIRQDFALEVTRLRPLRRHQGRTRLYSGNLLGREVVVRLAKGRNACRIEAWAYRQFGRVGVPAPQVLAHHAHPRRIGYPTIIMTRLPGRWLDAGDVSAEEERSIYRQLGLFVHRMHGLEVPGFGRLTAGDGQVTGEHHSWHAFVNGLPRARVVDYLSGHRLIDATDEELLIVSLNRLDEIRLDQAVFVHGDLHRRNVLVDDGHIVGIIDVESGQAGDPRLDIAVSSLWQTSRQWQAFAEGYGDLASDPWVACYRVWVAARKLAWRHETGLAVAAESARKALTKALHEPWPAADEPPQSEEPSLVDEACGPPSEAPELIRTIDATPARS
jgi:aminoglycoside phosphotransferase (APT) family kinase protein